MALTISSLQYTVYIVCNIVFCHLYTAWTRSHMFCNDILWYSFQAVFPSDIVSWISLIYYLAIWSPWILYLNIDRSVIFWSYVIKILIILSIVSDMANILGSLNSLTSFLILFLSILIQLQFSETVFLRYIMSSILMTLIYCILWSNPR